MSKLTLREKILLQKEKVSDVADQIYKSNRDGGINSMVAKWAYDELLNVVTVLIDISERIEKE